MAIGTILVGVGFPTRSSSNTLMWLGGGTTEASNPLIAEALAMLVRLNTAATLHLTHNWIKSDPLQVVNFVKEDDGKLRSAGF